MTGSIVLTTLLMLTHPDLAAEPVDPGATCSPYGCTASVFRLFSGAYVLRGDVTVPAVQSQSAKPPAGMARVRNLETGEVQEIGVEWMQRTYVCCCPVDWHGTFADALSIRVHPGDRLEIVVGADTCFASVMVPVVVTARGAGGTATATATDRGSFTER